MEFTEEHKEKILMEIAVLVADRLEKEELTENEVSKIANFVLDEVELIENKTELIDFMKNLASEWPIFEGMLSLEEGKMQDLVDDEVAESVETLVAHGKLEKALLLLKKMTGRS